LNQDKLNEAEFNKEQKLNEADMNKARNEGEGQHRVGERGWGSTVTMSSTVTVRGVGQH
jgi:hypothetical protein